MYERAISMLELFDLIYYSPNSNTIFGIIIFILVLISGSLFYLLYTQNKEIANELKRRQLNKPTLPDEETKYNAIAEIKKEQSSDIQELQSITKELETLPREKTIKLTPYEEEQEEKAIISYEELISKSDNVSIIYSDTSIKDDDLLVKQVDLENTGKIELDPLKKELNSKVNLISYEHEEAFLSALKQLQNLLN